MAVLRHAGQAAAHGLSWTAAAPVLSDSAMRLASAWRRSAAGWCCFAEGTSSDGNRVLPFKSALFSVAERGDEDQKLTMQSVSLAYTS